MSDFDAFPTDERQSLEGSSVAAELARHADRGYRVRRNANGNWLTLTLDEANEIRVMTSSFQVQGYRLTSLRFHEDPRDLAEFRLVLDHVAGQLVGEQWAMHPRSGRTAETSPATNFATFAGLVGSSEIDAIYDPYLTNDGLLALSTMLAFGTGRLRPGLESGQLIVPVGGHGSPR